MIALVRRRDAIVVAGVLAGLAAGLGVALAHPVRHRAEASVIVAPALRRTDPGLATMTRTAASLVRSDAVAQNVVAALHLDESPGHLLGDIGARPRHGTAIESTARTYVAVRDSLGPAGPGRVPRSLLVWPG